MTTAFRSKKYTRALAKRPIEQAYSRVSSTWPAWTPVDLRIAHIDIANIPRKQWIATEPDKFIFPEPSLRPVDYLVGLSTPDHCREVVLKLATDPRMKPVWARLAALESRVRAGNANTFLTNRPNERVSCSIARRCTASIAATRSSNPLTRKRWARQHAEIARATNRLRNLIADEGLTHPDFRQLLTLFSAESLRTFASEVYFHLGPHAYQPLGAAELLDRSERAQSREEVEAEEAEWDRGVEHLEYWLEQSIHRGAPKVTDLLGELERLARLVGRNPPLVGHSNPRARQVAALCDTLTSYFQFCFRAPLDETVATIVDVLTETGTTGAAVKARRHRLAKHRSRARQ